MPSKDSIVAVLVTHNRPVLFKKSIDALLKQNLPLKKIIVIDNASDIPVKKLIDKNKFIDIHTLSKNFGGSAGYAKGMTKALKENPTWIWLMDDDAYPKKNTLKKVIEVKEKFPKNIKIGALCSSVYEGGKIANYHQKKYNWNFGTTKMVNLNSNNKDYIEVDICSFVGLLLNAETVKEVGLPIKDFFICHDDMEYSLRMKSYKYSLFLVPSSKIYHSYKLKPTIKDNFGKRHYYEIRNHIFVTKKYSRFKILSIILSITRSLRILRLAKKRYFIYCLKSYFKALNDGLYGEKILD